MMVEFDEKVKILINEVELILIFQLTKARIKVRTGLDKSILLFYPSYIESSMIASKFNPIKLNSIFWMLFGILFLIRKYPFPKPLAKSFAMLYI